MSKKYVDDLIVNAVLNKRFDALSSTAMGVSDCVAMHLENKLASVGVDTLGDFLKRFKNWTDFRKTLKGTRHHIRAIRNAFASVNLTEPFRNTY